MFYVLRVKLLEQSKFKHDMVNSSISMLTRKSVFSKKFFSFLCSVRCHGFFCYVSFLFPNIRREVRNPDLNSAEAAFLPVLVNAFLGLMYRKSDLDFFPGSLIHTSVFAVFSSLG